MDVQYFNSHLRVHTDVLALVNLSMGGGWGVIVFIPCVCVLPLDHKDYKFLLSRRAFNE